MGERFKTEYSINWREIQDGFFLYSLLHSKPFTKIIFDAYNREIYHIVEEYLKPVKIENDQALFIVPETLNKQMIEKNLESLYMFLIKYL